MTRCWNCGLPDVAERCPRCGAPQEQARRGAPPPAGPSGAFRPPPGFIVNGAQVDMPPPGNRSGPLRPPGNPSGSLPPMDRQSGPLRPAGNQSGPLPPAGGYPPRPPLPRAPGGRSHPNAGPPGWDAPQRPAAPLRGPGMPLPSRSGPLPPFHSENEGMPPEYRRSPWSEGQPAMRPAQAPQAQRGWDADQSPEPPYGPPPRRGASQALQRGAPPDWQDEPPTDMSAAGPAPEMQRKGKGAPQKIQPRPEPVWDESERWGWSEPDELSLSSATNAILGAAIGGVLGGAAWVAAAALTGFSLPYLTVVVGLLAGLGARFALVQTRPWIIGGFGALGAALAFLVTQYALFDYALIQKGLSSGLFPLSPLRFPQVYINYVIGVADDVNHTLGFSGQHPLDMALLLTCMLVCWGVLLRRKK